MLKSLKNLVDCLLAPAAGTPQAAEHTLQLATAVLLVEVIRADASFHDAEGQAVLAAVCQEFMLGDDEAARLAGLATTTTQQATDLFGITSQINHRFDMAQKLHMVELMWQVADADGHLADHERHMLWRVADLPHLSQGVYVHARIRAQAAAGIG